MREIKFKFIVENHGGKYISREYSLDKNGLPDEERILEDMEAPCNCSLNESVSVCEGDCLEFFDARVIEKIQYTGLKDMNGKEIYEGGILSHSVWGLTKVIWEHGMFRGTETNSGHDITLADHQLNRSRVVGDIYTTPELLEEKGEGQ